MEMTVWLTLEPLPDNDLITPTYATQCSAGLDFAACLKRPCISVDQCGNKVSFYNTDDGIRVQSKPNNSEKPILVLPHNETILIPLGYKCEFDPEYVLFLCNRSSMGSKGLMVANGIATIDADYRGELFASVYNRHTNNMIIEHGQRIVQGVLLQCFRAVIRTLKTSDTVRGEGGFGSTGN